MSTIRAATVANLAGTGPVALMGQWANKAVVKYDGSTQISSLSRNVSSLTDNGVGSCVIMFTHVFSNALFAGWGTTTSVSLVSWCNVVAVRTETANGMNVITTRGDGSILNEFVDMDQVSTCAEGDLA